MREALLTAAAYGMQTAVAHVHPRLEPKRCGSELEL